MRIRTKPKDRGSFHMRGLLALALAWTGSCGGADKSAAREQTPASAQPAASVTRTLGWLGARAHPFAGKLRVAVDGTQYAPGGLVVGQLEQDGALATSQVRTGDVIVRVDDEWLPLEEDPSDALLSALEQRTSSGREQAQLGVWREAQLLSFPLMLPKVALEVGLPVAVERFQNATRSGVEALLRLTPELADARQGHLVTDLATLAWVGLALRSAGAYKSDAPEHWKAALERCDAELRAALAAHTTQPTAMDLCAAVLYLVESLGPLPESVRLRAPRRVRLATSLAAQGQSSLQTSIQLEAGGGSLELESLLDSLGEDAQVMTFGAGDLESFQFEADTGSELTLPEGLELPEGVQIFMASSDAALPDELRNLLDQSVGDEGPQPALKELLQELDPERLDALAAIGTQLERLAATQQENGSFARAAMPEPDAIVLDSLALLAYGSAARAGWEGPLLPLAGLCTHLKECMQQGKVASAVVRGSDRRAMAARCAVVAWAFLVANCPESDPFVKALLDYSDEKGVHLLDSNELVAWGTLATAAVRRQRGLANWQRFYDEFRISLVSWQCVSGEYALPIRTPNSRTEPCWNSPQATTALGILLTSMQSEGLPLLTTMVDNPFAAPLDSDGKVLGAIEATPSDSSQFMPAPIFIEAGGGTHELRSAEDGEQR